MGQNKEIIGEKKKKDEMKETGGKKRRRHKTCDRSTHG